MRQGSQRSTEVQRVDEDRRTRTRLDGQTVVLGLAAVALGVLIALAIISWLAGAG